MHLKFTHIAVALTALSLGSIARAGFTNGGFEAGDLSGWTVRQGFNNHDGELSYYGVSGQPSGLSDPIANVAWGFQDIATLAPTPTVVDKTGYSDPFIPTIQSMFVGNKMARLNDIDGYYHVTQISQTGTINSSDLTGGATTADLYINWAGVMDDPGHSGGNDPWFVIDVYKNGSLFFEERHFSSDPGWTLGGSYYSDPVYTNAGQVHLNGLVVGDQVNVALTVADCAFGGHGAYAYLDGIGTSFVPPPTSVPDSGATALLLVPALLGLVIWRRRH